MAENQQTFILVGQFKDGITPSLRKLNTQISSLTKTFGKFSGTLRPISKELGIMAMAADRLAAGQKASRSTFEGNVRVLKEYKRTLGQVTSAQDALSRRTPKTMRMPQQPAMPQGGGGLPIAASGAAKAGQKDEGKGIGFWGLTGATFLANMGVQAATNAFHTLTGSLNGFVQKGSQAQQAVTNMAGTIMTLGKVGNYQKSADIADKMMGDLGKVAAALPGSTEDYLTILQQTLDDQIQAFGSVEAVQKNLAGFDPKTGEKLAGGVEHSFTALYGMAAQVAGLSPQIAAMDLNQLRQSPENIRNVQLLTRNPTLAKFYLEELKKSGGDFILALDKAMKKAIPKEQIEALKNSFDSAYQSFITTFTDPYSGVFAPMRKVKIKVFQSAFGFEEMAVTTMDLLGAMMRNVNDIISLIMGMDLVDPIKLLNEALFEVLVWIHMFRITLEDLKNAGNLNLGTLVESVGDAIGMAIANFSNWLLNLDYEGFFKQIDKLVFHFFRGLFRGFLKAFKGKAADQKGPLGGLGTSVSGTIVTLLALGLAIKKVTAIFVGVTTALSAIQFTSLAASIAGWAPVIVGAAQAIVAGVATFATTMAVPLAIVVGAILGTVAIIRHGDFILSSLWEGLKMLGNGFMWLYHGIQEFQAMLMSGLMKFLAGLPGVGRFFKGAAEHFENERLKQQQHRLDREKAIAANWDKISDNTSKSLERTRKDFETIGSAFKGGAKDIENSKTKPKGPRTKADTIGGGGQGGGRGSAAAAARKPVTPKNYTVGGIEYDWKTGMPVKAQKPPATPKPRFTSPQPARAARPTAPAPAPKPAAPTPAARPAGPPPPANLAPAAVTSIQTAVTNGVKAAQATQAQTWVQALAPILAAVSGVGAKIGAGFASLQTQITSLQTKQTAEHQVEAKLLNSVIISSNGTKSAVMAVSSKVATQATQAQVASDIARIIPMLNTINQSVKSSGMGGMGSMGGVFNLPTGDGVKKVVSAGRMLQGMGLNVAEHPAFGTGRVGRHAPGSYHYAGRAIDVTGTNAQLDAAYARLKGTNPAELLWRVPGHYDHLHVAYARGIKNPTVFSSATEAIAYEKMMMPSSARVQTVTSNTSEGLMSGHTTVNQNITINGAQDPQRLAELVFDYASRAAQRIQNASFA